VTTGVVQNQSIDSVVWHNAVLVLHGAQLLNIQWCNISLQNPQLLKLAGRIGKQTKNKKQTK